jgi:hypothetical protein
MDSDRKMSRHRPDIAALAGWVSPFAQPILQALGFSCSARQRSLAYPAMAVSTSRTQYDVP